MTESTRFRRAYRALAADEEDLILGIKEQAEVLEGLLAQAPQGRYTALALTALEESVMWAVKSVTG